MEMSGNELGTEKWSPGLWKSEMYAQGTAKTGEECLTYPGKVRESFLKEMTTVLNLKE